MSRTSNLMLTLVLLVTAALMAPAGEAAAARREVEPSRKAVARSVKHRPGTADPVLPGELVEAAARPTPTAVDSSTFEAWKQAAADGPAASVESGSLLRTPRPRTPVLGPTFDGLDQAASVNNGYKFSPPDTQVAKGPTFVVEATNSALRMTTTTGTLVDETDLNTFFGANHSNANGGLDLLYDPRVYFDRNATNPRYFVVAAQSYGTGGNNGVSRLWLGISRGSDPNSLDPGDWCSYGIDARRDVGTAKASWADYPQLGVGRDALVISANQFRFTDYSFTYADVRVFDKEAATSNLTGCPNIPFWTFRPSSSLANTSVFSLQPVQAYTMASSFKGTKNPAYLVSTDVPAATSTRLHVWRIKNVARGAPTMTWKSVSGTFTYSIPPNAPQPGGGGVLLDTGDTRVLSAASRGDAISAVWNTGCQFLEGNAETCIVYARVGVGQTRKGAFKVNFAEEFGWGLGEDQHVFYPSLAVGNGDYVGAAAQWVGAGPGEYLGTVWLMKARESVGWPYVVMTPGSCTLGAADNRAGDYTGAQTDPGDNTGFWLGAEYAYDPGGGCTWGTTVTRLLP